MRTDWEPVLKVVVWATRACPRKEVALTNKREPDYHQPRGPVCRVQSPKSVVGSISFKTNSKLAFSPGLALSANSWPRTMG